MPAAAHEGLTLIRTGGGSHTLVWGLDTCLVYASGVLVVVMDAAGSSSTPRQRFLQARIISFYPFRPDQHSRN